MNRITAYILILASVVISSCRKEATTYVLDDYIIAGQKEGPGIDYVALNPEIHFTIIDPWVKTDTLIHLDLDKDGINDLDLSGSMGHPSMLGADYESCFVTPLSGTEICTVEGTNFADTIIMQDTIHAESHWSGEEALLYSYSWIMDLGSTTTGCWFNVPDDGRFYAGFRIRKNEKTCYGWLNLKGGRVSDTFGFVVTGYAITKEYPE